MVKGTILACQWVRLACERHIADLTRWSGKDHPYYFDPAAGSPVCDIIQRFPHKKGVWAQQRHKIELEPWQCFILCVVAVSQTLCAVTASGNWAGAAD